MNNSHSPLLISNIYKNAVFDAFLFINYDGLGKSTIPSTGKLQIFNSITSNSTVCDKSSFVVDAKSLIQTNATILAGALIFLTLGEKFIQPIIWFYLIGIYFIVVSIIFCLMTVPKRPELTPKLRELFCIVGVFSLFTVVALFLNSLVD